MITIARHSRMFAIASLILPGGACNGRAAFTSFDKNITFTLPAGWKADEEGGAIRITAADRSKYSIVRDQAKFSGKDASTDPALRSEAERLASSRVSGGRYAGVRPLTVPGGSGAIFRFRGKGSKSDDDLAEIWTAVVGSHTLILAPSTAPQSEHFVELSSLFKSISVAGSSTVATSGRGRAEANSNSRTQSAPAASTTKQVPQVSPSQKPVPVNTETRGYSGRLLANDVSFKLNLTGEKSASAEWVASPEKTSRFTGDYSGSDGNYVVNLTQTSGTNPLNATKLTLTMRALGGMESGTFTTDASTARRNIAELSLTSIDSTPGIGKLKSGNRPNAQRRGRMNNRGRMGKLGKIPRMTKLGKLRRLP